MLYWHSSANGKKFAKAIQQAVVTMMGEHDRGVKDIAEGGRGAGFLSKTVMPAVISEPFFLSNDDSPIYATVQRAKLGAAIAGAILKTLSE